MRPMLKDAKLELGSSGAATTKDVGAAVSPASSTSTPVVIQPSRGAFDLDLRSVWTHRELLQLVVLREIKVRYKQAALGVAWAVIQPVFAALIFTVVFGIFARVPSDGAPYVLFVLSAVIPWTYFAECVRRGSTGLVDDAELIRKIYFPRLVLPLAAVISPLLDLSVSFAVLAALMAWYRNVPGIQIVLLPAFVALSALASLAIALWLGPLNVKFRDVKQVLPFLLQVWMYASPIVYPITIVPERWRLLYSLNPMVGIIEGFRWTLLGTAPPTLFMIMLTMTFTAVFLTAGLVYFRRAERSFADVI